MPVEVLMPMLGMAQETGKLVRWLKAEGDSVAKAEPLMEVETDKVTVEIEAPAGGTLAGVTAAEGDEVAVGTVIAYVLAAGEEVPAPVPREAAEAGGAESNGDRAEEAASPRALASPKARRLAAKRGVPIEEIAGSGPHGAVLAADVEGAPAALAPDAGVVLREQWRVTERKPLEASGQVEVSSAWRTMAKRLAASWP